MLLSILHIICCALMQFGDFRWLKAPDYLPRNSEDQRPRWNVNPFRNKRSGANQTFLADFGFIQKNGSHADQRISPDSGPMQNSGMPDGHALAQNDRDTSG